MRSRKSTKGIVIAGSQGEGSGLSDLYYPHGLFLDAFGTLHVADSENDRIMRWSQRVRQDTVIIGGTNRGSETNELNHPFGLTADYDGNIYVVDHWNNRVQRFSLQ